MNQRKKTYPIFHAILLVALALPMSAFGDQFALVPRVAAGILDYEYTQTVASATSSSSDPSDGVIEDTLPFIGFGLTTAVAILYADLYIQTTSKGKSEPTTASSEPGTDIERQQILLTIGITPIESWSVFAGYRLSKSEFERKDTSTSPAIRTSDSFEYAGPFIGTNKTWKVNPFGETINVISAKFSINYLVAEDTSADFLSDPISNAIPDPIVNPDGNLASDLDVDNAFGINFGLAWAGKITTSLTYNLSVDYYQYEFDNRDGGAFQEEVLRYSASLAIPLTL